MINSRNDVQCLAYEVTPGAQQDKHYKTFIHLELVCMLHLMILSPTINRDLLPCFILNGVRLHRRAFPLSIVVIDL